MGFMNQTTKPAANGDKLTNHHATSPSNKSILINYLKAGVIPRGHGKNLSELAINTNTNILQSIFVIHN